MPWINTTKTPRGFDYSIGQVVIARANWVATPRGWQVCLSHMAAGAGVVEIVMPLAEVTAYLHAHTTNPPPEEPTNWEA